MIRKAWLTLESKKEWLKKRLRLLQIQKRRK